MISFDCPSCSQTYTVSDDKAGRRTACKNCSHALVVPQPDWELAPESSEDDESNAPSREPICPQCSSTAFAFKPIYGPVSFVQKREQLVAQAAEVRDEAARRVETARTESERAAAAEQQREADLAFEATCRRIGVEHPTKSRNRLYLVYCTSCGHVVTATPAAGNIQEGLEAVNKAINRLHNTVVVYIQAMETAAKQERAMRTLKAGLNGLGELLSE